MKKLALSTLCALSSFAVSQASFAETKAQPQASHWYYTVSVDPHWGNATVHYYNNYNTVWHYTLPCSAVAYGYECAATTAFGAPLVYSWYHTAYSYVTVSDVVYHCYNSGVCY